VTDVLVRRYLRLGDSVPPPLPPRARAAAVLTPYELAREYDRGVSRRLLPPPDEVRLYGVLAEMQLADAGRELRAPQYLLLVDTNPNVQAALLFWRLLPGSWGLVGASPVSTGGAAAGAPEPPSGVFEQAGASASCRGPCPARIYDFGWHAAPRTMPGIEPALVHVQVRAADRAAERRLGRRCSSGILVPASLIAYLDRYGLLDGESSGVGPARVQLPYRGSRLLLVDSERDERPAWSPPPAA
jgi:hypothetical protein